MINYLITSNCLKFTITLLKLLEMYQFCHALRDIHRFRKLKILNENYRFYLATTVTDTGDPTLPA